MTTQTDLTIEGLFYSGKHSQGCHALMHINPDAGSVVLVQLDNEEELISCGLDDVSVPSRLANTQRRLGFADGGAFLSEDNDAIDRAFVNAASRRSTLLHVAERSMPIVLVSIALIVLLIVVLVRTGIPRAAESIAQKVPVEVQNAMSVGALEFLDSQLLLPSELPVGDQLRITELVDNDDELLAVVYHEIGHLRNRHLLRRVLQTSFLALGLLLMTGEVNSVESLVSIPTVYLSLGYTRDFEIEADRVALELLHEDGLGVSAFTGVMTKLGALGELSDSEAIQERRAAQEAQESQEAQKGQEKTPENGKESSAAGLTFLEYLSTHPQTSERLAMAAEFDRAARAR